MKMKRHHRVTPVYRASGYIQRLPPVSRTEKLLWLVCLVMLLLSVALIFMVRGDSNFVERYYSLSFYPLWAGLISSFTRFLPFSLGEWVVLLFAVACVIAAVFFVIQLLRYRRQKGKVFLRFALRILAVSSAILMGFTLCGGLNYYRYSFVEYSALEVHDSELSQLADLCRELVQDANTLRVGLAEDEAGASRYTADSAWALCKQAPLGYQSLVAQHPEWQSLFRLAVKIPPKPVFFSEAMSYMQIVGVFFPYTVEANVNIHTTDYNIPNAMSHELAHVAGFMREDEANFISYLACRAHADPFFRYSGTMLALAHSGNALYGHDPVLHGEIMGALSPAVQRDMALDSAYFQRYDTRFGDFSTAVNDTYLKVNNQTDGVAGYGRMVDLLLADYRARHSIA